LIAQLFGGGIVESCDPYAHEQKEWTIEWGGSETEQTRGTAQSGLSA
jgi:hypothetical protein